MGSPRHDDHDMAVRDGQLAPVTCAACGCRLETVDSIDGVQWFHYGRMAGKDARGDRPGCVDVAHDSWGLPALAA